MYAKSGLEALEQPEEAQNHLTVCLQQMQNPEDLVKRYLMEAIDEGLAVLGDGLRPMIYSHLEQHAHLPRDEIPDRLDAFSRALKETFGIAGGVIERLIARRLFAKLDLRYWQRGEVGLVEYVENAKLRVAGKCTDNKSRITCQA